MSALFTTREQGSDTHYSRRVKEDRSGKRHHRGGKEHFRFREKSEGIRSRSETRRELNERERERESTTHGIETWERNRCEEWKRWNEKNEGGKEVAEALHFPRDSRFLEHSLLTD